MVEKPFEIKAPIPWLPAGLISWYSSDGFPVALVTSWVALVGGDSPRIRTAWHGRHVPSSRFWTGGDFVLNVPYESGFSKICQLMGSGSLFLNAEVDLGQTCVAGIVAVAPRLLDCAVQIECVDGKLANTGFDVELCGDVVLLHRDEVVIDPVATPDLCAIHPLQA